MYFETLNLLKIIFFILVWQKFSYLALAFGVLTRVLLWLVIGYFHHHWYIFLCQQLVLTVACIGETIHSAIHF